MLQTDTNSAEARLDRFIADSMAKLPVESKIVKRLFNDFHKAGNPIVSFDDGEEEGEITDLASLNRIVFNLDEVRLYTRDGGGIFLVNGEGWDMIADYNTSLEPVMAPINAWVMRHW